MTPIIKEILEKHPTNIIEVRRTFTSPQERLAFDSGLRVAREGFNAAIVEILDQQILADIPDADVDIINTKNIARDE